ncbi:4Fe-4S binding protein [Candidatus Bathyarchaeota archaeon]|nr:4Fe-4S binding protein [Candidatus Bathyarchaeota archaeon]
MGKISVYRFLSAGCNGCDVQVLECLVPRYRLAELNVEVVSNPEEANVLILTGGVNIKGREELIKVYEKVNPPKIVIAVGNCALTKEIFDRGYPMVGPPDKIVPVNFYVPGCPPRPQAIVKAVAHILGAKLEEKEDYWAAPEGFRGKHEFDRDKCIGCGACAQVCSSDAIDIIDESEKRVVRINYGHCSFCAFCQDECPTQAIRLTSEYYLLTNNRGTTYVTNDVNLLECASCGVFFFPQPQIDWALKRIIEEKVPKYREFKDEILDAMKVCLKCRREIMNVRNAKKTLAKLSAKARGS